MAILTSALVGRIAVAEPAAELWLEITGLAVPATPTPKQDLSANVLSESWWNWEQDGIHLRLAQVRMSKPYTMAKYLRQWRRVHACCVTRAVKGFALSASVFGPQITIAGNCEAGGFFAIHFVKVAEGFIELHADSNRLDDAPVRKALRDLLVRAVGVSQKTNEVVLYLDGAELQVETDGQRREILRALEDLRTLNPATLQGKRYADYQNVPGKWTLATLLHKYFVPGQPRSIDEKNLYQDAQLQQARLVIGRQMLAVRRGLQDSSIPRPRPSMAQDPARGSTWGGLSVIERGSSTAPRAVILIHGYGSRPDDLVPLAEALAARVDARFIVPAAPRPFRGGADGRVWFDQHLPDAQAQIRAARSEIDGIVDTLQSSGIDSRQVIVAGFSQGAILSIEMALAGRHPLCGIAVLSGRALGHPAKSYRRLAGLPIFSAHGRNDERVPFQRGHLFVKRARFAGADVRFEAFDGEHEIPAPIVTALGDWLAERCR